MGYIYLGRPRTVKERCYFPLMALALCPLNIFSVALPDLVSLLMGLSAPIHVTVNKRQAGEEYRIREEDHDYLLLLSNELRLHSQKVRLSFCFIPSCGYPASAAPSIGAIWEFVDMLKWFLSI